MTLTNTQPLNGVVRQRGRAVPAAMTYTFKDTGITVQMHRISPMTLQHLNAAILKECKALPADHAHVYPKPPVQMVAVGGGEPIPQVHDEDPDYLKALAEWQAWSAGETSDRMIRMMAIDYLIVDDNEIRPRVEQVRRMLRREGVPLDEPEGDDYTQEDRNRIVYLRHVCLGSSDDLREFSLFLSQRTQPSEEAIQDAVA